MSTRAIREALERIRWDGLSGKETPAYAAALAEVEAIEKAAGEIYAKGDAADPSAWALMDEIYHDSPKP